MRPSRKCGEARTPGKRMEAPAVEAKLGMCRVAWKPGQPLKSEEVLRGLACGGAPAAAARPRASSRRRVCECAVCACKRKV